MGYHHLALAARDMAAVHHFYEEVMGFELVKVEVAGTEAEEGWAKHAFYDTGGQGMLAFWDIHDESIPPFDPALSRAHGLPTWVNHVAFDAHAEHRRKKTLRPSRPADRLRRRPVPLPDRARASRVLRRCDRRRAGVPYPLLT